jgi:UDP-N-acetylglucosamine 1-carboxyvinyltransferase
MARLVVDGGHKLQGKIIPSANKNAVLPILCASLLSDETTVIEGIPDTSDVRAILDFFIRIGSQVEHDGTTRRLTLRHGATTPADLPIGIRSAVLLLAPLLHRWGEVRLPVDTTGCTLGAREIDPHIDLLCALGARVSRRPDAVLLTLPQGWRSAALWPDYASVTATESFAMAAVLAPGTSRMVNAACEPHVQELCDFLALLGARIEGTGTSTLTVHGGLAARAVTCHLAEDHHEIATFLALGAITGGCVSVRNSRPDLFPLLDRTFAKFGITIAHADGWSTARAPRLAMAAPFTPHLVPRVEAAPWPYVPADLLPIFIALGVRAEGTALFWNKVYEGALGWTRELARFGARLIECDPHRVMTVGGLPLSPAEVDSPYIIRVAIALLMVAASIDGRSVIHNADPIRRAHPDFAENLVALGGHVRWIA